MSVWLFKIGRGSGGYLSAKVSFDVRKGIEQRFASNNAGWDVVLWAESLADGCKHGINVGLGNGNSAVLLIIIQVLVDW